VAFIFELNYDFRILLTFYFAWFYQRFFMKTKQNPQMVGDPSSKLEFSTFFPEKTRPQIQHCCDIAFSIANCLGAFDYIQKKFKSPL